MINLDIGSQQLQHWRIISKIFVILNAFTWSSLMLFAPESITYDVAHTYNGGFWPGVVMLAGMFILIFELFFTDHRISSQSAISQLIVPTLYMIMGGAYLIFAFMSALVPGTVILVISSIIQAFMSGAVALTQRMQATHVKDV